MHFDLLMPKLIFECLVLYEHASR